MPRVLFQIQLITKNEKTYFDPPGEITAGKAKTLTVARVEERQRWWWRLFCVRADAKDKPVPAASRQPRVGKYRRTHACILCHHV